MLIHQKWNNSKDSTVQILNEISKKRVHDSGGKIDIEGKYDNDGKYRDPKVTIISKTLHLKPAISEGARSKNRYQLYFIIIKYIWYIYIYINIFEILT